MDIGQAVAAMRSGNKVRRPGWTTGRWIGIRSGSIEWGEGDEWKGITFMCGPAVLLASDFQIRGPVPGRKAIASEKPEPAQAALL